MNALSFGYGLCAGLFCAAVFAGLCSAAVFGWALSGTGGPLDDTDNKVTGERSNLHILIDHGTGCQYLRMPGGGLTPRLDASGVPICSKVAQT